MVAWGIQQAAADEADMILVDNIHFGGIKLRTESMMGFRDK